MIIKKYCKFKTANFRKKNWMNNKNIDLNASIKKTLIN
jgi:hypothetical protein